MKRHVATVLILSLFFAASAFAKKKEPKVLTQVEDCAITLTARFTNPLHKLRGFFEKGLGLEETIDLMKKDDARYYTFQLEELMRLYRGIYGKKAEILYEEFKLFEDALGRYLEKEEYLENAQELNAPKEVLDAIRATAETSREDLRTFLLSSGWLSPNQGTSLKLDEIESTLKSLKWKKEIKDTKAVLKEMIADIKEVETYEMDPTQLQDGLTKKKPGVHKMRRLVRKYLIAMQALDGMILLQSMKSPMTLNEYSYLDTHPIATNRFSVINKNSYIQSPVFIPRHLYLALSKIVNDLGAVKESGEMLEALTTAYQEGYAPSGLVKDAEHAHDLALKLMHESGDYLDFSEGAQKIKDELERTNVLREMRKALEKALEQLEELP